MLIVSIVRIPAMLKDERELKDVIANERFKIAEGKIENLLTQEESGHFYESFSINGVSFLYSDLIIGKGFNQTSKNSGPIKKEGQVVRIYYTVLRDENIILKLQIADATGKKVK
jgi:hypothetical protein